MAANCDLATTTINALRLNPVHSVLFDLGQAAVQYNTHTNEHFQRLIAYLIDSEFQFARTLTLPRDILVYATVVVTVLSGIPYATGAYRVTKAERGPSTDA